MSALSFLCRFCAKEKPQHSLVDFKSDTINGHSMRQKLLIFSEGFLDFTNKCLPETVCTVCCSSLDATYEFFVQVKESQVILSRLCTDFVNIEKKAGLSTAKLVKKKFVSGTNSCATDTKHEGNICAVEDNLSWSKYPWHCSHCNTILPSMQAVREHSQETHGTCYGFQCADCDEKLDSFEEFVKHVVRKQPELKEYCEYCNMKMESLKHKEIHTACNCTYCGQIFTNETSLHAHLKKYTTKDMAFLHELDTDEDALYRSNYIKYLNTRSDTSDILHQNDIKDVDLINGIPNEDETIDNTASETDVNSVVDDNNTSEITFPTNQTDNNNINFTEANKLKTKYIRKNEQVTNACESVSDVKIQSWSQYPPICKFCDMKFSYLDILKKHCILTHRRCFGMKCVDCQYNGGDTFEQFVQHVRVHRPYLKNICHYCDIKMYDSEDLHAQTHISRNQCTICAEIFNNKRELRRHDNKLEIPVLKPPVERRKGPITDKDITCNVCGKRMKSPASLRAHKVIHTERKRIHTCDRCGKAFFTRYAMDSHHKIHDNIKTETCKICNKSFLTIQRLRKHVKTHNLEMPFQCDECKKLFSSKDSLRSHVTVHMNIKPYVCQYCSKRFRNKHTMKTHENQHTGARPYPCDVCCINFVCWSNCDKHMRRIHGIPLAKTVKTPHGQLAIDPETGKPSKVSITSVVKEWSKSILERLPYQRRKKP